MNDELTRYEATRLLLQRAVLVRLKELNDAARETAKARLRRGETRVGLVDDAIEIGKVTVTRGSGGPKKAVVTDRKAFAAWVEQNYPQLGWEAPHAETIFVPGRVREGFERGVLAAVKADGGFTDENSGEVVEVPGVTVEDVPDVLKVLLDAEAAGPFVDRLLVATGLAPLLELPEGNDRDQNQ